MVARNILHALAFMAPVVAVEFLRATSRVTLTLWQADTLAGREMEEPESAASEGEEGH